MNLFNIYKVLFFSTLMCYCLAATGHELNCQAQVVAPKLQNNSANTEIFNTLQMEVMNFMNNTKWSQDIVQDDEQIECSVFITLDEEVSPGNYKGSIQVQCSRPVYNSSYLSPLFTFKDTDFQISYDFQIS